MEKPMKSFLQYLATVTVLLMKREIGLRQWAWAVKARPVVVSGRSSGWVVDHTFNI